MSLATPSCVQKLQAASHGPSCVFSESRMREIRLSRFDEREQATEPSQTGLRRRGESFASSHREANATAPVLDSTPHFTHLPFTGELECNGLGYVKNRDPFVDRPSRLSSGRLYSSQRSPLTNKDGV